MRFTGKTKLACSFGIVLLLSMAAGGVAYMKLSDMIATAEDLVSRSSRVEKASELEKDILLQARAEKNIILSTSDAELDQFVVEMTKVRVSAAKTREEIFAAATEAGKKLIERFGTVYGQMNAVQDQIIKLAKTDKAKATEHSMT